MARLLAPFAPHLGEELWARIGGTFSVHEQPWPDYDEGLLIDDEIDFIVQVNRTRRGVVRLRVDDPEEEVSLAAGRVGAVRSAIADRPISCVVLCRPGY